MIGPMKTRLVGTVATVWKQGDSTLFGTLWVLAACLATLATLFLPGCSDPSRATCRQRSESPRCARNSPWTNGKKEKDP